MKKKPKNEQTFLMSYAYDVPHYADFTVTATSRRQAEAKAKRALKEGRFGDVNGTPAYENTANERVFTHETNRVDSDDTPMEKLDGFSKEGQKP